MGSSLTLLPVSSVIVLESLCEPLQIQANRLNTPLALSWLNMDYNVTDGTSAALVLTSFLRTDNARIRACAIADNILQLLRI